jgi:hypothetical protein
MYDEKIEKTNLVKRVQEVLMYDEKIEKTNLVKRVQEMSVCYFLKSIIGVWYTLRSYLKVVLIISWDPTISSNGKLPNERTSRLSML